MIGTLLSVIDRTLFSSSSASTLAFSPRPLRPQWTQFLYR